MTDPRLSAIAGKRTKTSGGATLLEAERFLDSVFADAIVPGHFARRATAGSNPPPSFERTCAMLSRTLDSYAAKRNPCHTAAQPAQELLDT
jgi:hypothetical protein